MVNSKISSENALLAQSNNSYPPEVNWTLVYAEETIPKIAPTPQKRVTYDQLLHVSLGAINQEMRTPLALIFQTIEMLEDSRLGSLTDEQLDALMVLRRQAQILSQMIDGLPYIAAYSDDQKKFKPVLARLDPIFDSIIPLAEFRAQSKEISIETEIAPNLPPLYMDVKQIEEALTQLLDNAIKFNRAGGHIKITAQADDTWITLTVSDTGKGIVAELLNKIWDAFEQGVDPLGRSQEGLGADLSLAQYIIEDHRGTVEVDTQLGQGTTFTVKLPRAKHTC